MMGALERPLRRPALPGTSWRGWIVVSQGASSVGNLVLAVVIAQAVSATEFGAFSLLFATYTFVLSFSRALLQEPLLFDAGYGDGADEVRAVQAGRASLVVGLLVGAAVLVAGLVLLPEHRAAVWVGVAFLPALLLQDHLRYRCFAMQRHAQAAALDVTWLLLFVLLSTLLRPDHTLPTLLMAWGLAAAVSIVCTPRYLCSLWNAPLRSVRAALRRSTGWSAVAEWSATNIVSIMIPIVLAIVVSVAAAGAHRAAQTVLGVVQVAFAVVSVYLQSRGRTAFLAGDRLSPMFVGALALLDGALHRERRAGPAPS